MPAALAELAADLRAAARSGPVRGFLLVEAAAAGFVVARRGPEMAPLLGIIAAGSIAYGLLAWYAGRLPGATRVADPVPHPMAELACVAVAYLGLAAATFGWNGATGSLAFRIGLVAWLVAALAPPARLADLRWLARTWLPLTPLLLAVAAPKIPLLGLALVPATLNGLVSGLVQQLLLQVVLLATVEAVVRRADLAAVIASLGFGFIHAPLNLPQAGGDWPLALANALVLQATIGLVFCIAYLRHRAALALGFGHALAMA